MSKPILSDEEIDKQWIEFKTEHRRKYIDQAEEEKRKKLFTENLLMVAEHNEKYAKGESTFKMSIDRFSDLTPEERDQLP